MIATVFSTQSPSSYPWFNALDARPALRFALQPDKLPPVQSLVRQGTVMLSRRDMEVLFGPPTREDSQMGTVYWSMSFLDRTRTCSLSVLISSAHTEDGNKDTPTLWCVDGIDNRSLQAVREYVRYHLGDDAI